jgi:hypothetical protein
MNRKKTADGVNAVRVLGMLSRLLVRLADKDKANERAMEQVNNGPKGTSIPSD